MPSFVGSSLFVESVTVTGLKSVEVVFGQIPISISAYGANDALNPQNYSIISEDSQTYAAENVSEVGDRRFQVFFDVPVLAGTWVLSVSNVLTPTSTPLVPNPNLFTFVSTQVAGNKPLSGGAQSPTSASIIKRHISSLFQGKKNWESVIASLASGDDYVARLAESAFKQLFLATASGGYLKQRGSDLGFKFPVNIGLSEDDYRKLVIDLSAEKITQQSFQRIIEAFFGKEAVRAHMDSTGTLASLDEKEIILSIDGSIFHFKFYDSMFQYAGNPTTEEICAILNQEFNRNSLQAFAETAATSLGDSRVRIYSGKIGLGGRVSCLGGSAQLVFKFPTEIVHGAATIDFVELPNQDKIQINDTVNDFLFINAQKGDYIILTGPAFELANRGQFEILDVIINGNETSAIIKNVNGVNDSSVSVDGTNFAIFRPTIHTVTSLDPYALVAQASGETDVVMPVTSPRVNGNENESAYLFTTDSGGDEQTVFDIGQTHTEVLTIAQSSGSTTLTFSPSFSVTNGQSIYFGPSWSSGDSWLEEGVYTVTGVGSESITFTGGPSTPNFLAASISDRIIAKSFVSGGNLTISTDVALGLNKSIKLERFKPLGVPAVSFCKLGATALTYASCSPTVQTEDGVFWSGSTSPYNSYKFDKNTQSISTLESAPTAFSSDEMIYRDGKVYNVYNSATQKPLIYDEATNSWYQPPLGPDFYKTTVTSNRYTLGLKDGSIIGLADDGMNLVVNRADSNMVDTNSFITTLPVTGFVFSMIEDINGNALISRGSTATNSANGIYRWSYNNGSPNFIKVAAGDNVAFTGIKNADKLISLDIPNGAKITVGGINLASTITDKLIVTPIESAVTQLVHTLPFSLTQASAFVEGSNTLVIMGGFTNVGLTTPNRHVLVYTFKISGGAVAVESFVQYSDVLPNTNFHQFYKLEDYKYFALTKDQKYGIVDLTGKSAYSAKFSQDFQYVSPGISQPTFSPEDVELSGFFPVDTTNGRMIRNTAFEQFRDTESLTLGPYILDQEQVGIDFLNITLATETTLVPGIQEIQISGTLDKTAGFLIYGFGFSDTLSLMQIVAVNGNLIKVNYVGPNRQLESGKSLHYTQSRSVFTPEYPELMGLFYAADSVAMRKYAELLVKQAKAVGSTVNVKLLYPGTVGLGNGNISTESEGPKLNDGIYIWGDQDELDKLR